MHHFLEFISSHGGKTHTQTHTHTLLRIPLSFGVPYSKGFREEDTGTHTHTHGGYDSTGGDESLAVKRADQRESDPTHTGSGGEEDVALYSGGGAVDRQTVI